MLKKLLAHLGYIHKSELTEEFLLLEVSKLVNQDGLEVFPKKLEEELFRDLSLVDNFLPYLNQTMINDMQREFSGPKEQKDVVVGAYSRTAYLKGRLLKARSPKV